MSIKKQTAYGDKIVPKKYCLNCGHRYESAYARHGGGGVCSRRCDELYARDGGYPDNSLDELPKDGRR